MQKIWNTIDRIHWAWSKTPINYSFTVNEKFNGFPQIACLAFELFGISSRANSCALHTMHPTTSFKS